MEQIKMNTIIKSIAICLHSVISCAVTYAQVQLASSVIIEQEKPTLQQSALQRKLISTIKITNKSDSPISVETDMYNLNCTLSPCVVIPPSKQDYIEVSRNDDTNLTEHGKVVLRINKINSNMDPAKPRQIEHFLKEILITK